MANALDWNALDEFLDIDELDGADVDYSVIGPTDDRFQVRARAAAPSTRLFPYNTICFLEGSDGSTATGTLIAPQVVLTAKHVLTDASPPCAVAAVSGNFVSTLRVTPGADLSASSDVQRRPARPSSQIVPASRMRVHPTLDVGVAILPRAFASPTRFMMLQPRDTINTAVLLTVAGYPCDKPNGTMWAHSERLRVSEISPTHLRYRMDTCPGHSGSPVWLLGARDVRLLLGVHTTGAGGPNSRCPTLVGARQCAANGAPVRTASGLNCGVRITCDVIRFIEGVCRAFRVRGPEVDRAQVARVCPR